MPQRPWPLWSLTGLALLGFPAVNFIYWPEVLRSGVLSPDADSIDIPIFGSIFVTLLVSPVVLGISWLCLKRYNPETRFTAWRHDRPYRSIVASVTCGAGAVLIATSTFHDLKSNLPWYEYLWTLYFAVWLPWLLALRAAAIDQRDCEPI